ncbi:MAG: lipid-A-disaccharide synthase-related protein [Phormidesmis sp.]
MNLLCISNGHGEDIIALRILSALRQQAPNIQLSALPISGAGSTYRNADIDIIGPTQRLPSGGFLNQDPKQLARDMRGGLISLTRSQLSTIKKWTQKNAKNDPQILAVGDIVPLIFAHRTGLSYHFIGTAKSEYWLRDERGKYPPTKRLDPLKGWSGSVYLPWERWLMTRPNCRSVFVRDALTAQHLQTLGIRAQYAGNPMMDGLAPTGALKTLFKDLHSQPPNPLTIILIPGSRPPEAYDNWTRILQAIPSIASVFPAREVVLLGAIAPSLSLEQLKPLPHDPFYKNVTLKIITDAFNDCLAAADIAIATAGTATEQLVGLGKPAITLPGPGPQYTKAFATVQAKMLGPSIEVIENPKDVGNAIAQIINTPTRLETIQKNGKQRMGTPGASQKLASQLLKAMTD